MSEYDNFWLRASWEARNLMTPERERSLKVSAIKRERKQRLDLQRANRERCIFDQEVGGTQNLWIWENGELVTTHKYHEGWLEKEDGTREKVWCYLGDGWLTIDEWSERRRLFPRGDNL